MFALTPEYRRLCESFPIESVQRKYRPMVYQQKPPFPAKSEDKNTYSSLFWAREWHRCKEGWVCPEDNHWVNPILYFMINHYLTTYTDNKHGCEVFGVPLYTVQLEKFYNTFLFEAKAGFQQPARDIVVGKPRAVMWSEMLKVLVLWHFVFVDDNIFVGLDTDDNATKFKDTIERSYNFLPDTFKHEYIAPNNQKEFGRSTQNVNTYGQKETTKLYSIQFSGLDKSVDALKGGRGCLFVLDEFGKVVNGLEVIASHKDNLIANGFKKGSFLVGGTTDAINPSSYYKELYLGANRPKNGWIKYPITKRDVTMFDWDTGQPMYSENEKYWLAERAKISNRIELQFHIQNNPLYEKELFYGLNYSDLPTDLINEQYEYILQENIGSRIRRGRLDYEIAAKGIKTGNIDFNFDSGQGEWYIFDEDIKEIFDRKKFKDQYFIVVDGYKKDQAKFSDSKGSIIVYKREAPNGTHSDYICAIYEFRPEMVLDFVDEIEKAILYFDCHKVLVEVLESEGEIAQLKRKGLGQRLMWFNGNVGLAPSEQTLRNQMVLAQYWFRKQRHQRIYFTQVLEAIRKPREENSDLRSCFYLCMSALEILKDEGVFKKEIGEDGQSSVLEELAGYGYESRDTKAMFSQMEL